MADPLIGKKIGQYEILSALGQGGMAMVYRAQQIAMKREVAVKVVSGLLTQDPHFKERFNREVELIASLEHPNIVPVYDHGTTEDGIAFLVMRFVKGGTLTERVRTRGALPLSEINTILQQIGSALEYAHRYGVIHRDIKPSNVLLDDQGGAYLADFGLAQMLDPELRKNLTEAGALVGTPTYISPEQVQQGHIDHRSDIYSLGIVLYEMVSGRPPFSGDSVFAIMQAHVTEPPPLPRRFRPDLPMLVEDVLNKALQKDPSRRYQSASELVTAFNLAVTTQYPTQRVVRTPKRASITLPSIFRTEADRPRPIMAAAGVVTALLLLALGVIFVRPALSPTATLTATSTVTPPPATATPTSRPVTPSPTRPVFADESQRPAQGMSADLVLTDEETKLARQRLEGSFIGIMACSLETEYHASLVRSVRTHAEALGFSVKLEDAKADRFRQPAIINSFVAQGAKVIFVCPIDETILDGAIRAAQEAGIVVLSTGEVVYGKQSVTLTLTNEAMGRAVGLYTAELINRELGGKANVAILNYPPAPAVELRADAMEKYMREKAPQATILGRWKGGLADEGEKSMQQALKEHPEINVIMSINDAGAFGAVKALRAAGKKPDEVMIISVDAEAEARRMIEGGEFFRASLDNDPVATGTLAIDAAVKLLAGSIIPRQIAVPGKMIARESKSQ